MTKNKKNIPPYNHLFTRNSLERAYGYTSYIKNVHLSPNSISCKVKGTYPYQVDISWDENDYTELSCTCPYDYEGYCKHIAAVLIYLEDNLGIMPQEPNKQKKPEWQTIIESLSIEELQALIIEYAEDNENLINTILVKYSQPSDDVDIDYYKNVVDSIFESFSEGYGYISYEDVYPATHLISNLLDNAESSKEKNAFNDAFSISAAIAESCIYYIQNADDSNGAIGGLINVAFDFIGDIFNECDNNTLKNLIYEWLNEQMNNPSYDNYGCDETLYSVYFDLGSEEPYRNSVLQFIDEQLNKYKNDNGWSAKYNYNKFLYEKMTLLSNMGKEDEVQSIIENNLHLEDIRRVKVKQLLEQKEFSKAINCIKEGIRISEQENLSGVTSNWKNLLLEIYENQGMVDDLKKLAKEMIFDGRKMMDYYLLLKTHQKRQMER